MLSHCDFDAENDFNKSRLIVIVFQGSGKYIRRII
jgi:hypothetical protein